MAEITRTHSSKITEPVLAGFSSLSPGIYPRVVYVTNSEMLVTVKGTNLLTCVILPGRRAP